MRYCSGLVLVFVLAGCSSSARSVPAAPAPAAREQLPAAATPGRATFSLVAQVASAPRSVALAVDGGARQVLNLTGGAPGCSRTADAVACTLAIDAAAGSHTFDLTTYAAADANGTPLSTDRGVVFSTGENGGTVGIALGGTPASLRLVGPSGDSLAGNVALYDSEASEFAVYAFDAEGRLLLGAAAPKVALNISGGLASIVRSTDAASFLVKSAAGSPSSAQGTLTGRLIDARFGAVPDVSVGLTVAQPWIYVAGSGKVLAFDEQGNPKSTPGGFPGLRMPGGIAYDSANKSLYVLDRVTQKVKAFDLLGYARNTAGGFRGLRGASGIAYDTSSRTLVVSLARGGSLAFDENGFAQSAAQLPGTSTAQAIAFAQTTNAGAATLSASRTLRGVRRLAGGMGTAARARSVAFVADARRGAILALDEHGQEIASVANRGGAVAFSPYSQLVYAGDPSRGIVAFDQTLTPIALNGAFSNLHTVRAITVAGP